jgi:cytochrome P450
MATDTILPPNVPADRVYDIDIYAPSPEGDDYHKAWSAVHAASDKTLLWSPRNDGHWFATRAETITTVLSDYEHFSSRVLFVPRAAGEAHDLAPTSLDPPRHRPYRAIVNSGLGPKALARIDAFLPVLATELIETFRADGHCNFTRQYAQHFPIRIFMGIVNLPVEDAPTLKAFADQTTRPDGTMSYEDALKGINAYLEPVIEARRGGNGDDLLSKIVNGEVNGEALDNEKSMEMCTQVLIGGLDTVVNMLSFMMLFLATHETHRRELVADRSRIPAFINELLRRFSIATTGRIVVQDYDFEGISLKAGDMVMVPTTLHGLDPQVNPDPLRVDLDRKGARHSVFGSGNHTCPGAHLARMEIRATLEQWLNHIPEFRLAPGATVRYAGGIVAGVSDVSLVW